MLKICIKKYFPKRKNTFFISPIYIDLKYAIKKKKKTQFKAISVQKLSSQRVKSGSLTMGYSPLPRYNSTLNQLNQPFNMKYSMINLDIIFQFAGILKVVLSNLMDRKTDNLTNRCHTYFSTLLGSVDPESSLDSQVEYFVIQH